MVPSGWVKEKKSLAIDVFSSAEGKETGKKVSTAADTSPGTGLTLGFLSIHFCQRFPVLQNSAVYTMEVRPRLSLLKRQVPQFPSSLMSPAYNTMILGSDGAGSNESHKLGKGQGLRSFDGGNLVYLLSRKTAVGGTGPAVWSGVTWHSNRLPTQLPDRAQR